MIALDLAGAGFGEPLVLLALVAVPLAALASARGRRARQAALAMLGGAPALRGGADERRRLLAGIALLAALTSAILAAARPQWGEGDAPLSHTGIDVVIALDVSRSMEAQDIAPSRAQVAADGLVAMLGHLTGNRVGLVTFAGTAFERAPLTVDLEVLSALVSRAQSESALVRAGTNLGAALDASLRMLDVEDPASGRAIVLISDGEDLGGGYGGPLSRAEQAGVPVYTVFAGTTSPTALPETSGGTDVTTAEPAVLVEIAEATGAETRSVEQIAGLAVEFRRLQQTEFGSATERRPVERFPWFAAAALVFVALALLAGEGSSRRARVPRMRAGAIVALLGLFAATGCGTAVWRSVEAGNEHYEAGRHEDALAAYDRVAGIEPSPAIDYNAANALHRLERYEEAAERAQRSVTAAYESEDSATALLAQYTAGNTAFMRGQLDAAREAYVAALRIDSADRDAKANLELVLRLQEPEPEQPQPEPGEGQEGGPGQESPPAEPQPGAPQPGQSPPGATPPPDATPVPGDPQPGPAVPSGEQREAALDAARVDLAQALGELGPEVTPEEARRILELTRRVSELEGLPGGPGGAVPAR